MGQLGGDTQMPSTEVTREVTAIKISAAGYWEFRTALVLAHH
jgi:hypothetical protein